MVVAKERLTRSAFLAGLAVAASPLVLAALAQLGKVMLADKECNLQAEENKSTKAEAVAVLALLDLRACLERPEMAEMVLQALLLVHQYTMQVAVAVVVAPPEQTVAGV